MTRELNVEAPTEEQIKALAHETDKENLTKHYVKKYSDYEEGIDTLNTVLNNWIKPDNYLGDLGQKVVMEVMGKCGWEVDPILQEISNKYVNLLEEVLSKCPFSKEQAKQYAVEHLTNTKHVVKRKSLWEWIFG